MGLAEAIHADPAAEASLESLSLLKLGVGLGLVARVRVAE
jgi:hypothetical protein